METTTLCDLPNELFPIIVGGDVEVHRGLALACKRFFTVLTPISYSMRLDYEICAGHTVKITKDSIKWYVKGKLNRDGDQPAVEEADGTKEWWVNERRHRVDGPAIERTGVAGATGRKEWWINGKRHREDGPAIEWEGDAGMKAWWVNGNQHRDGDFPAIEWADGTKQWYVNGERHRDRDLPAIEYPDGRKEWWVNGERHRVNGPAIEFANGKKAWFINGIFHQIVEPVSEETEGSSILSC